MTKKMNVYVCLVCLLFSFPSWAKLDLKEQIEKYTWNGIEVIWLKNPGVPKFNVSIYFSDGASSDSRSRAGETEMMFELLSAGTNRYNQDQISDALDFYGSRVGSKVYHEYTTYSVEGLEKYMLPTMKMVCHMFSNSQFPRGEVKSFKKRLGDQIKNMVSDRGALADRVFRKLSLAGTPFELPSSGELKTIKRISTRDLKEKRQYFNKTVAKRIYLTGPKSLMNLRGVFEKDCGWDGKSSYKRYKNIAVKKSTTQKGKIYFLPVKNANQAQVRLGRFISGDLLEYPSELLALGSGFLGGGFTAQLIQELRVKRGLTYSASAYAGNQRTYGRSLINTFTKNETVHEMLTVIKEIVDDYKENKIDTNKLDLTRRFLAGSHLFSFESNKAFLNTLLFFDHIEKDYDEIYLFPDRVKNYRSQKVTQSLSELFDWEEMVIFVMGDPSIKSQLRKMGPVVTVKESSYL